MASFKVSKLCYTAFRLAGILPTAGRGYSVSEGADAINALNSMVLAWKAERLMVRAIARTVFAVVPNKASYTVALTGADWTLEPPERIDAAGWIWTNQTPSIETPIQILEDQEYEAYSPKGMTSTAANRLYLRRTVPAGTIYLLPVPTLAYQVALYTWQAIQGFADLDSDVIVADEYQRALEYNLAVELAMRFPEQQNMSALVPIEAAKAKRIIKTSNSPRLLMQTEAVACGRDGHGGRYNIFSNRHQ